MRTHPPLHLSPKEILRHLMEQGIRFHTSLIKDHDVEWGDEKEREREKKLLSDVKPALCARRVILRPSGVSARHSAWFEHGSSVLNAPSVHQKMLGLRAVGWHHRGGPIIIFT